MTDLDVIPWIRLLSEGEAVSLARSLIHAEAGRLGLPLTDFSMSGRLKARDQGIDGRTHFPEGSSHLLPVGPQVWQVKSGTTLPSAASEFDQEKHAALIRAIRDGSDYVLFWTNDPVNTTAEKIEEDFSAAAKTVRADAKVTLLLADSIQRLCYAHLAVLSQFPNLPLRGVISLDTWGQKQDFGITFQYDDPRRSAAIALRAHVLSEDASSSALHLYGDTGVGKSRLVYEALMDETTKDRVLVALSPDDLDRNLLSLVASSPERRLILVVDECSASDRKTAAGYTDMAQGRIRLITIGSRYSRDPQPEDSRYLEMMPLATEASRQIALSVGLSEQDAAQVAHYTEGYPKLAFVLADAMVHSSSTANLLDRVRSESVAEVLSSMLTNDADTGILGVLALFERLGYDDDLAQETTIACSILDIGENDFRDVVDRELNRFVSSAGRYRLVTPRLLAVWLASHVIRQRRDFVQALRQLPESLQGRIIGQMKAFAGDRHVSRALRQLLQKDPFTTGALDDVDEGSARLIHVAAIVDPGLAMDVIDAMLHQRSTEELRGLRRGRRGFVNALEVLIWFDETFERAASALLRLAVAENESWSNNATGAIQGVFQIHLGGTSVPYSRRLAWALKALSPDTELILVPGLANALTTNEMRVNLDFASRTASPEWRPTQVAEEMAARRGAWQMLVALAKAGRNADAVASALATGLRDMAASGLGEEVVADLATVTWSPAARAQLSEAIGQLLEYDQPEADFADRLKSLHESLVGSTLQDQLAFLLSQQLWQLYTQDPDGGISPLLSLVAQQIAREGRTAIVAAARVSQMSDPQITGLLFERIGAASEDADLQDLLESERPLPEAAVLGMFTGLAKTLGPDWSTNRLRSWLAGDLGRLVIQAAHTLPASDELADLAISTVSAGRADPRDLGRLLYGAWASDLSAHSAASIANMLGQTGQSQAIEHALGIVDQWLGKHPQREESQIDQVALSLIKATTQEPRHRSPMLSLFRQKIIGQLDIPFSAQLEIAISVLSQLQAPADERDLQLVESLAKKDPDATIRAVVELIDRSRDGRILSVQWLEQTKILTRLASATSPQQVLRELSSARPEELGKFIAHVSFDNSEPGILVEYLIANSSSEIDLARAAFSFSYPGRGWSGSEAAHLRSRRAVALSWLNHTASLSMQQWLRSLIRDLDEHIARAERSEAEERY